MKILQIIYDLASGGVQRFVVDLCNDFLEQGHLVTICALRDDTVGNNGFNKKEIKQGIKYISLKIPPGLRFGNIYKLYKIILREKPDVVHAHQNLVNYIFPLTYIFPKLRFFHTIHNDAPVEVSNKLEYSLRIFFYSRLKVKAITISDETTSSFKKYYGINSFKQIINGRNTPAPTDNLSVVKKEINNNETKIFIHIARYHPIKNQQMLVNVFNRLKRKGYDISLHVIGSGFDSDQAAGLRNSAGKHIQFIGEKHNIPDYLLTADAFCLSSVHEGMPITVIEAFACGCTPVCTPAGGIKNMIVDGENGFIAESTSEDHYYETLERYMSRNKQIDKKNLIDTFYTKYHIHVCAKKYLGVFQEN